MKPGSIQKFVQELKRRRVFRGIVVYGASTLILLEATINICNAFGIETVPRWFVILLGVGFLGSLWFSWIYDITPGGIVRTEPSQDHAVPIPNKKLKTYRFTTFASVAVIIGLVSFRVVDRITTQQMDRIEKSIAVLPYIGDRLTEEEVDRYIFIGHELTSCLTKIRDYRVIPWEDSRKYPRKDQNYITIGENLSAAILVDWWPHKTQEEQHLAVDLISTLNGSLIWSEIYPINDNWSGSEICQHTRKISKHITRKLRIYPSREERANLNQQPVSARATMFASLGNAMTDDALDLFQTKDPIFHNNKLETIDSISFKKAITYYDEAIKEDPDFAEAYANRAKARLWAIRAEFFNDHSLDKCKEDILKAFALNATLHAAHVAMGLYYYYGLNENRLAHVYFDKALDLSPDNMEGVFYLAKINSTLGNWDRVSPLALRVFESNSRNALFLTNLGTMFLYLNDFSRSIECQERAIKAYPKWGDPYINKMFAYLAMGDIVQARDAVTSAVKMTGKNYYRRLAELEFLEGNFNTAIEFIEQVSASDYKTYGDTEGDVLLEKAKYYKHAGHLNKSKELYHMAVKYYKDLIMFNPRDAFTHSKLGLAYAGIGLHEEAISSGKEALELVALQQDAIIKPLIMYNMIGIHGMIGDIESANTLLQDLLALNSYITFDFLTIDPEFHYLFKDSGVESFNTF
jgi:serine/threonine-protein kinase